MITNLMENFNKHWVRDESTLRPFIVEDTGKAYRLIIKNTCDWYWLHGGCTMCNYTDRTGVSATTILKNNSVKIIDALRSLNKNYSRIKLYINGSFFNENELKRDICIDFIKSLKEIGIAKLCVETRPEYVSKHTILDIKNKTGIDFEICFGLESSNDLIRNQCYHKGFAYSDFLKAFNSIKDLCTVKVYLLIKPPFVTEKRAIEDVLNSVETLVKDGVTHITYKPIAIQENTLLEFLLQENLYRPVWLWSIIEINSRLKELRDRHPNIHLGALDYYPRPLQMAFNCEHCSEEILELLAHNRNLCWEDICIKCACYDEWKALLDTEQDISVKEEISMAEDALNRIIERSKAIYLKTNSSKHTKVLCDVAKTVPQNRFVLDNVGVENVRIPLKVDSYEISNGNCSYSIELDPFHRGIHMSRLIERLYSFSKKVHKDILADMTNDLMFPLTSTSAEISFSIIDSVKNPLTSNSNFISLDLICRVSRTSNNVINTLIYVSIPFINACPCTKETVQELFNEVFTHTQRGKINIAFHNSNISLFEIVKFAKKYVGLFDLLKREDEVYVVSRACKQASFCEDICREVTKSIKQSFSSNKGLVSVKVVTEESIHPHNAYAIKAFEL